MWNKHYKSKLLEGTLKVSNPGRFICPFAHFSNSPKDFEQSFQCSAVIRKFLHLSSLILLYTIYLFKYFFLFFFFPYL